jgi:DNA polymerase I-like protein with 3'-5' exonuclease and polymerase domains
MWFDGRFLALDLETGGELREYALQPWRVAQGKAWITSCAAVYKSESDLITKVASIEGGAEVELRTLILDTLEDAATNKRTVCTWNGVFDIAWLLAYGYRDLVHRINWLDGMLLWRHYFLEPEYDENRDRKKHYGLKDCVAEVMPQFAGYQDNVTFDPQTPGEWKQLCDYNIRDTAFTLRLCKHWYNQLNPRQLSAALIEARCLPMVAQANLDGIVIDTVEMSALRAQLTATADAKLESLAPFGVSEQVIRSPTKLAALLFDQWGLPVLRETKGTKSGKLSRSTDKGTLHELAFMDPRAKELREYREALNNRTKFCDAPIASAEYNGDYRSHPSAMVFSTYTGRLTYASKQGRNKDERQTGFALHQEKRDKAFRRVALPPPGYTLMEFDASGQEYRWMAICSGDPVMLQMCLPGEDPHSYMASRLYGEDYKELVRLVREEHDADADKRRFVGKFSNLSNQYRISPPKLMAKARVEHNLPMDMLEAKRVHATYLNTYRQVPRYWDKQIAMTKRLGYVETLAGRRVQVVGNWSRDGWRMGSTGINYRIQGTGADQKYLAMAAIRSYLTQHGIHLAWELHDGLYLYVPDNKVDIAAVDVKHILDYLPYRQAWGITPEIPLPWDCKAGPSWGALREHQPH